MSHNNHKNQNSNPNKGENTQNMQRFRNSSKQQGGNKAQQNTAQNSTGRTRRPDGAESAAPVLTPFPGETPVIPGYIRSQQQMEQGGADQGAVKQLKQFGEEHEME